MECERFNRLEIEWIEDVLTERFGPEIKLTYNKQNQLQLSITNRSEYILFETNYKVYKSPSAKIPCTEWDASSEGWSSILNKNIPTPGYNQIKSPLISKNKERYFFHFDIISFTFWMLSRYEETLYSVLDEHERFPATSSHAFKHGYLERPIVDEWLDILRQVLSLTFPDLELKKHAFKMYVSHDVDSPSRYRFRNFKSLIRGVGGDLIKRQDIKSAFSALSIRMSPKNKLHNQDSFNTFNWIMDTSEKNQIVSAFYFICGRTHPKLDADYDIDHPVIRNLLRAVHKRGHEIGLHPSYNTFNNPEAIINEANRLKQICKEEGINQDSWGGRMHYLRWKTPITMHGWEGANMNYDSSLGYADSPGFRCGTCFEYTAFDAINSKKLNLRIRPLIAMESTIIAKKYLGLGLTSDATDKFIQLKKNCQQVAGNFSLLWHNSELYSEEQKYIYENILKN
jgi:Family of unknown function (DUF7033)